MKSKSSEVCEKHKIEADISCKICQELFFKYMGYSWVVSDNVQEDLT